MLRVSVSLISQASSEHSICFSVPETLAADARESLEREFAGEIGRLAGVTVPIVPMAHEYLVTRPSGVPLDIPTMSAYADT